MTCGIGRNHEDDPENNGVQCFVPEYERLFVPDL